MVGDPLGDLNLSQQGVIDRDELVFRYAYEIHKVPMVMLLSGGYQQSNAPVIAESIQNLCEKFQLLSEDAEPISSRKNDQINGHRSKQRNEIKIQK